jgi:hypothetical protein
VFALYSPLRYCNKGPKSIAIVRVFPSLTKVMKVDEWSGIYHQLRKQFEAKRCPRREVILI